MVPRLIQILENLHRFEKSHIDFSSMKSQYNRGYNYENRYKIVKNYIVDVGESLVRHARKSHQQWMKGEEVYSTSVIDHTQKDPDHFNRR